MDCGSAPAQGQKAAPQKRKKNGRVRYRISEIKIGPAEYADKAHRKEHIRRALNEKLRSRMRQKAKQKKSGNGITAENIEIIRESIDARHKPDVKAVYTLDFDCGAKLPLPAGGIREYEEEFAWIYGVKETADADVGPESGEKAGGSDHGGGYLRPVIAGFGPCGIFAALILAEAGLQPIVLERGRMMEQRVLDVKRFWEKGILDPESNVQFGEGGAGAFSDGKLTTGIRDIRIRKVLKEFVAAGADPEILYQQRPHIGTDQLRRIIPRIRQRILELGGEIRFGTKLAGLKTRRGRLEAVLVSGSEKAGPAAEIKTEDLIVPF